MPGSLRRNCGGVVTGFYARSVNHEDSARFRTFTYLFGSCAIERVCTAQRFGVFCRGWIEDREVT